MSNEKLTELFTVAGVPESAHDAALGALEEMVAFLAFLLKANAPNYITFGTGTAGDGYEFTIRKSDGLTPAEKIQELEEKVQSLRQMVADPPEEINLVTSS